MPIAEVRESSRPHLRRLDLSIVGMGTVGRWLAEAVERRRAWLEAECGVDITIVGAATRRGGFVYSDAGLEIDRLGALAAAGRSFAEYPGVRHWPTAFAGLAETACDVLAEASNTNPREPEPAESHIRAALLRGIHVVTSSKGACAAAGVELLALARKRGVEFRMESTVMSGTPVLSTIREGLAGARVLGLRGILNGTANHILTLMAEGLDYPIALMKTQALGYAEPDPSDDVDGHDAVAKVRILAAVAFGRTLSADAVAQRGITEVSIDDIRQAASDGARIKPVASIRLGASGLEAEVGPIALPLTDPLARIDGVTNALTIETDTLREVTIVGPGAGREQAGQGMFADLVAVARRLARD